MRQELQAVDEDAGHGNVAQRLGLPHQGQMALVQVAHGGHKSGVLELRQMTAQFGNSVNDFHNSFAGQTVAKRSSVLNFRNDFAGQTVAKRSSVLN